MAELVLYKSKNSLAKLSNKGNETYPHLTEDEINRLTQTYIDYKDESKKRKELLKYKKRWRQFIIFMILRETGARIGELLAISDNEIDYDDNSILIRTLKQKKEKYRTVFISDKLLAEISRFLMVYPEMQGKLFDISKRSVQYFFENMCSKANIIKEKSHIHILRHTRAIELIKAGVPLHHVKQILGHSSIITTSVYLNTYSSEIKTILQERRLI